ncbi:nuclear transport factor 2 family protein [SAR86 cluster bacterium]|nr:nuclear transport factor 2 family protein [SAR86 cluster bacterium]
MNKINPIKTWHKVVENGELSKLDEILDEDCNFYSPVVFSPQNGRETTKKYLSAAAIVFADESFKYTKELISNELACLEFELVLNEININGIDIISWNEEGKITEFKVMIRPLKAVEIIHKYMGEELK